MLLFNRSAEEMIDLSAVELELLVVVCPEVKASQTMRNAVVEFCADRHVQYTVHDVWLHPDVVLEHRLMLAPAIVVLDGGTEIGRLEGPRSRKQIDRFLAKFAGSTNAPASAGESALLFAA